MTTTEVGKGSKRQSDVISTLARRKDLLATEDPL